jgi:hypothetical protein
MMKFYALSNCLTEKCGAWQKFVAVGEAKYCATTTSRNTKYRGSIATEIGNTKAALW